MRNLLLAGAAAVSMALVPAVAAAQSAVPGSTNSINDKRAVFEMSEEQQMDYDSWPADRQTDYATWPVDYQTYYWGLSPEYQEGYWALTPEQRTRIYGMAPELQETAWQSVAAQLRGEAPAPMATTTSSPATTTRYSSSEMVQGGARAERPAEYPICRGDIQDSCINPYAAGKKWGNKPLDYWPGKPASEM